MLKIIRNALKQLIEDMDSGNSYISESEQEELMDLIQKFSRNEMTKVEAYNYIGVSRATFDNYVNKGLLPKGNKRQGSNTKYWNKQDLDKFLNEK